MPAWIGPTATGRRRGRATGTVQRSRSGWSTSGRIGSWPAKRTPWRSCASRSSQSAAGARSTMLGDAPPSTATVSQRVAAARSPSTARTTLPASVLACRPAKRAPAASASATRVAVRSRGRTSREPPHQRVHDRRAGERERSRGERRAARRPRRHGEHDDGRAGRRGAPRARAAASPATRLDQGVASPRKPSASSDQRDRATTPVSPAWKPPSDDHQLG